MASKKNIFNSVKLKKPQSSVFDLSHDVKMSAKFGTLYPVFISECIPGDKFNISCESLVRFAPMVAPIMHIVNVFFHFFFVPYRLIWEGWEDFITNTPAPTDPPVHPYIDLDYTDFTPEQIMWLTYFGIPRLFSTQVLRISPMSLAAYQCIYHEYYRDQNLVPEFDYQLVNGDNVANLLMLRQPRVRAWEHDYFTAALPWAQKGTAVDIPLGDVILKEEWDDVSTTKPQFRTAIGASAVGDVTQDTGVPSNYLSVGGVNPMAYDPEGTLSVTPTTINDLRRAFRLQEFFERQALGGTRYTESNRAHFGVFSSDARLQRPEYITGSMSPVTISEVLSTTGEVDPLGTMGGHGISVTSGKYGSYYCEEHGMIIGIMSVMPKPAYQDGLPRMYSKTNFEDYFWPEFANIGEQEVLMKEINRLAQVADQNEVFGYVPRYAEYKYMPSRVAGDFQTTLDFWHLGRQFGENESIPLNQEFIECQPRTNIFAVNDGTDYIWMHIYHKVRARRLMPYYGTPTI